MLLNPKQTTRVRPVEPPYDEQTAEVLSALGPPLAVFGLLARKPGRARAIHGWGKYYLSRDLSLSLRHRELVIDRTTALCGSEYEWGVHIAAFAVKTGLTPAQVASTATGGPDDSCWTEESDRILLRTVDALVLRRDLADGEWAELTSAFDDDAVIDLLLLCGWYHAISFVTRATRLLPEQDTPKFPVPTDTGPA
jgi:alkylhydroperoxidase family enzyme